MKRNKDMMKKIFVTTCIVIMLIILAGMVVAYAGFGCSEVKIADGVSEILEKEGLDECRLISLPDYSGINYYLEIPDKSDVRDGKDSDDLITQELEMVSEKREEIMDQLRKEAVFDIDENGVADSAVAMIEAYESEANVYGMDLKEYCEEILDVPYDELYEMAYSDALKYVQNYLIIGGIAQNEFDEKDISYNDDDDIYLYYQELENMVYEKFITVEDGFFE